MVQTTLSQRCIWCGDSEKKLSPDHVFPRSLGGTKQLAVPACSKCQTIISKVEEEVARRSVFALYRIDRGPSPRKKSKVDSGSVEAKYILVKSWMGGYSEVALRAKQDPITLPCIELDVNTLNVRVHGSNPGDVDRLVEAILNVVKGPPDGSDLLGGVAVELLSGEVDADIVSDPDFFPRAFLDLRGRLKIRARDGEEARQFIQVVINLAQLGKFKDHSKWGTGLVLAGTPHRLCLEWDESAVMRVVAKIAYATAYLRALPQVLESESLRQLRSYVLGSCNKHPSLYVREIELTEGITEWPDHHVVLIESYSGFLRGIVVLYGNCFAVDLGKDPLPKIFVKPVVAMSRRDGTHSYLANDDMNEVIVKTLKKCVEKVLNKDS